MTKKIDNIIEELKSLTLLEASDLIKQIENVFGVDTSVANINTSMIKPDTSTASLDSDLQEQTEFDVLLDNVPPSRKIAILKVVRSLTGLGLKEAKELVESAPKVLKESVSRQDADDIKEKLENAGAKVAIK